MNDSPQVAMLSVRAVPGLPIVAAASGLNRVLGHEPGELRGRGFASLCPPLQPDGRDSHQTLARLFDEMAGGGSSSLAWTFLTHAGVARPHELHLTRMGNDGEPLVAVCIVDLSRLKFIEAMSAAENELLQMVATGQPLAPVLARLTALIEAQFDGLFCSVLLLDLGGRHVRTGVGPRMPGDYMRALDGFEVGPAAGSCGTAMHDDRTVVVTDIETDPLWAPYKHLVTPYGFRACWSEPIHAAGQGVIGSFAMYYRECRAPGEQELAALRSASHLAGIAIDQDRREQERLRAAQWLEEQVDKRTAELLAAQDELVNSRKLAALGQMLSGIAHEMNTPLGNALLAADVLRSRGRVLADRLAGNAPLKRKELTDLLGQTSGAAELVQQNVDRALRLINRFKQLTEDSGRAVRMRFQLRDAVLQAWARVQTRLRVRHVQFVCDLPEDLALDGYPEVLHQVLEQLLENACLHAFHGSAGQIRVGSAPAALNRLVLEVRDNGAGMPRADVERAFEPFFTTTFGQGGSGLGLFVVHNLVSGLLGGSIQLDSQPGQGTTVRLELPLLDALRLAA
ncbi:GAF domain-containing sensor histidine kinase [Roseateles saccharophilus]|uniref:histidine kinase n=1 Tax=Roseateles saccharophilus TaxID=304 RepID=A0A4R3VA74_ROSSA|nr:GAF domain-containing sensor histidine kinase [Roseateles saccharophilus]MDG0831664.1 sensor histidine kinase [Roseateles saccharophilus]TCV00921.1 phospho-acceptor domain-containing protein [Roseateles saccharophilus]